MDSHRTIPEDSRGKVLKAENNTAKQEDHETLKLKCSKCFVSCSSFKVLKSHIMWAHPEDQRKCSHCEETLQSKVEMQSHSNSFNFNSDPRGFSCDLSECKSVFKARCMLMKHRRVEHDPATNFKEV